MFNKKVSIWFTILFLFFMLSSLTVYWIRSQQETFADEIISKTTNRFSKSFIGFLDIVENSKTKLSKKVISHNMAGLQPDTLNRFFSRMVEQDKFLKGVIIFGNQFSYVLVHEGQTWTTTHNQNYTDSLVNWQRMNNQMEVVSEWSDTYSYFLKDSTYSLIKDELINDHASNLWISAQSQLQERRDLLMTIFDLNTRDQQHVAVAFLYSTTEMGNQFISVLKYKNPLVSVITKNSGIVTPMKTADTNKIKLYTSLNIEVSKLINDWQAREEKKDYSYSFTRDNEVYWTRLITIPEKLGVTGYGVTISASDLAKTENKQELLYVYLAALFFILGVLSYFTMKRKHRETLISTPEPPEPWPDSEILPMIHKGESEKVEFKSSLRWDYREKVVNNALEVVILKSISAFANAKGGTLFIGVSDNLEILGLEPDFKTLKKQDVDYFELHLRKLITNQFGLTFANHFLHIQFPEIKDKTICIIHIHPGVRPLFIKTKSKQGQEMEKFYVRSGNASQEVSSLKEMNDYINRRFEGK